MEYKGQDDNIDYKEEVRVPVIKARKVVTFTIDAKLVDIKLLTILEVDINHYMIYK